MRPPDPGLVDAPGLARDGHSIVMIEGSSATCPGGEGSGFVVAPSMCSRTRTWWPRRPACWWSGRPAPYRAKVVYFDPRRDIAVLYVPCLHARPLHFAASARRGSEAIVAGHPLGSR